MTQFALLKDASTPNFTEMDPQTYTQRNGTQISHKKSQLRLLNTRLQDLSMKTLRPLLLMRRLPLLLHKRKLLSDQEEIMSGTQITQSTSDDESSNSKNIHI
jgi:hypothetical protein